MNKRHVVSTKVDDETVEALDALANADGVTRARVIRAAIEEYVKSRPKENPTIERVLERLDLIEQRLDTAGIYPVNPEPKRLSGSSLPEVNAVDSRKPILEATLIAVDSENSSRHKGLSFNELCNHIGVNPDRVISLAHKRDRSPVDLLAWKTGWKWDVKTQRFTEGK